MKFKAVERGGVKAVAYSRDGKMLASGGNVDSAIKLWNVETGELVRTLEGHTGGARALAFSPDSGKLVSANEKVRLWDVRTGRLLREIDEKKLLVDSFSVQDVAFSADGRIVASGGDHLITWNVETGELVKQFDNGSYVVALSADGRSIASARGEKVLLIDMETGRVRFELSKSSDNSRIHSLAFSPDSKLLASAGGALSDVRIWDVETGALKQSFSPYDLKEGFGIDAVAFSPDGKLFASGNGYKGTITIWDTKTWELKATFKNVGLYANITKGGSINSIAFAPDSKLLASGDQDGMVKLWDVSGL
jgi:WD40 repeat protein